MCGPPPRENAWEGFSMRPERVLVSHLPRPRTLSFDLAPNNTGADLSNIRVFLRTGCLPLCDDLLVS
jgi:hypothetical protein